VCTGNICRSALAERLGRVHLAAILGTADGYLKVLSAGTQAVVGSPMHPDSALVLQGLGADPGDFRSRQLTEEIAASADLILTMTRAHRSEVLRKAPRALRRTFTLHEVAELMPQVDQAALPDGPPADRARALVRQLAAARSRRPGDADDDVLDPIGLPVEVHAKIGEAIAGALIPVLTGFAALAPSSVARSRPATGQGRPGTS
jgi:protein-tyrosine phosphatase